MIIKNIFNAAEKAVDRRISGKRRAAFNAVIAAAGSAALILTLGAFCRRNTIIINDDGRERVYSTASSDADEILASCGYTLAPADCRTVTNVDGNEIHITIDRGIDVKITVDGAHAAELTVRKGEKTADVLREAGIAFSSYDEMLPAADARITESGEINVTTADKVSVTADGETTDFYTVGGTLGELLSKNGITLGDDDEISADIEAEITEDMQVKISRVSYIKRVRVESIPYRTVEVPTPNLAIGERQVQTRGANSAKRIYVTEKYVDGEYASEVVTDTTYVQGKDEVVLVGTAAATPYSTRESDTLELMLDENGLPTEFDYIVSGDATAYTAREGCGTYSGRPLIIGSVGVDPTLIPFGSELYIISKDRTKVYGYAVASDTGDMTDIIADCYMGVTSEHYSDACKWGRQTVDIFVLKTGDNSVSWM